MISGRSEGSPPARPPQPRHTPVTQRRVSAVKTKDASAAGPWQPRRKKGREASTAVEVPAEHTAVPVVEASSGNSKAGNHCF